MPTDGSERARFITGLRDLADYLTDHPDVPVPEYGTQLLVFPPPGDTDAGKRVFVDQAAAALGVAAVDDRGHYEAACSFGPLAYDVLFISAAARAEYEARQSYRDNITTIPVPNGAAA